MKKTDEQFKKQIYELVSDEYKVVDTYINAKTKVKFYHEGCKNIFYMRPDSFISGNRCPICSHRIKYTSKSFSDKFYTNHYDEYELLTDFKDSKTKIKILHKKCNYIWEVIPNTIINAVAYCPRCSNKECKTHNDFVEYIKEKAPDYEILSNYEGTGSKVKILHKICGNIFDIKIRGFIYGTRCPYCFGNIVKSQEQIENEIFSLTNGEYEIKSEYKNAKTKIKFYHKKCNHYFYMTSDNFINGQRCPICKESKGEQKIRKFLESNNIKFIPQKTFDGLVGIKGKLLSYDFYLPNINLLIEFQGGFHDGTITSGFQSKESLEIQKEHDKRKKEYANNNQIDLLEIWYYEFEKIEDILRKMVIKE